MLMYYDYIRLMLCLVIVSCSPCPCNSQVQSQNETTALKYLESWTFTKIISLVLFFSLCFRATGVLLREKTLLKFMLYLLFMY